MHFTTSYCLPTTPSHRKFPSDLSSLTSTSFTYTSFGALLFLSSSLPSSATLLLCFCTLLGSFWIASYHPSLICSFALLPSSIYIVLSTFCIPSSHPPLIFPPSQLRAGTSPCLPIRPLFSPLRIFLRSLSFM